ncbi:MAG TPA: hypothetical protein PK850_12105 [Ignavibacteria bacterium]|mgnify:FL=1|nr:hypothetical protein [Bacteroidota bacterium]HRE10909.1 hypothetical protein [Ignavibacteria bacterium]HRF66694.1 hypothetical protein [Ignavibacteria bacterium]
MIISKIKEFFKSFRNKVIVIAALLVVTASLLASKYFLNESPPGTDSQTTISGNFTDITAENLSNEQLRSILSTGVDSVLGIFGIKNDWISNSVDEKSQKKTVKNESGQTELFTKTVLIPNELSSIEVNAELSSYFKNYGLVTAVNEDIITKDVVISVMYSDTAKSKLPLAKINIVHSEKVHRESAIVCVIINNITEYDPEDVDKLLINKSEFSFVFPRNLDEIDLQNKLLHHKKDVIINLTVGGRDNYETDFTASMDEKAIRERVKSFSVDFPTVTTVILTKKDNDINPAFVNAVANDLSSFKIKVIHDNELAVLYNKAEEESKDKFTILAGNLKSKGNLSKSIVTSIKVNKDEFGIFYDEVLKLKRLGYKFYNFAEFSARKEKFEKAELEKQEKIEKLKEDQQKKLTEKKQLEKKQNEKKKVDKKTDTKKNTDVKKKTDIKKPTEKKNTEPKKKSDVKKK